jgi:hypothetical protein
MGETWYHKNREFCDDHCWGPQWLSSEMPNNQPRVNDFARLFQDKSSSSSHTVHRVGLGKHAASPPPRIEHDDKCASSSLLW